MTIYFDTNWHCRRQFSEHGEVMCQGNLLFIASFGRVVGCYSVSLSWQGAFGPTRPSGQSTQKAKIMHPFCFHTINLTWNIWFIMSKQIIPEAVHLPIGYYVQLQQWPNWKINIFPLLSSLKNPIIQFHENKLYFSMPALHSSWVRF